MKITIICSWCNRVIQWGDNPTMDFAHGKISHGICEPCSAKVLADLKKLPAGEGGGRKP